PSLRPNLHARSIPPIPGNWIGRCGISVLHCVIRIILYAVNAKQKQINSVFMRKNIPSGAKAPSFVNASSARLKSCPDTKLVHELFRTSQDLESNEVEHGHLPA